MSCQNEGMEKLKGSSRRIEASEILKDHCLGAIYEKGMWISTDKSCSALLQVSSAQ